MQKLFTESKSESNCYANTQTCALNALVFFSASAHICLTKN